MQMNVRAARSQLSKLVAAAEAGEDVVIARRGRPAVRLVPVRNAGPGFAFDDRPVFGIDEGRFVVPDDFDDPLDEALLRAFEGRE